MLAFAGLASYHKSCLVSLSLTYYYELNALLFQRNSSRFRGIPSNTPQLIHLRKRGMLKQVCNQAAALLAGGPENGQDLAHCDWSSVIDIVSRCRHLARTGICFVQETGSR